jgi:predicted acylesterase/phospholipase RssA
VAATFALEGHAPIAEFFRVPYGWQAVWRAEEFWKGAPFVRAMIERGMPANAHEILSGRLHVSITCFHPSPRAIVVSNFSTRQSLIDALAASAAMPGLSGEPILTKYNGRFCVDGGLALNTPTFWDNKRDQLVINLGALTYPVSSTFYPIDKNHLELV